MMDSKILVVDDDDFQLNLVAKLLGDKNEVVTATTLNQADNELLKSNFDLILLDIYMPDGDGLSYYAKLLSQDHTRSLPVVFITGTKDPTHEITGFSLGADDFISKPVNVSTFRARIDARLKQREERKKRDLTLQKGNIRMSLTLQKGFIIREGKQLAINLTPVEFKLLFHFLRFEEQVFSRDQLLSSIWGNAAEVFDRTVDMHVSKLRRKITESDYKIQAVHGSGYRLTKTTEATA